MSSSGTGPAYAAKNVKPFRVATDPKPLGPLCICGCGKRRPAVAVRHEDPFASGPCCRAWYGTELPPPERGPGS